MEEIGEGRDSNLPQWLVDRWNLIFRVAMPTVVLVFVAIGAVLWLTGRFEVETVGYPGVWLLSFIGAASIFIPVPGLAAVCLAATPAFGLNLLFIGVLAGSAEAIGEMTGYMAGVTGRGVVSRHRWYPAVQRHLQRRGGPILFGLSIFPNPLFDVVGIAAGSTGYPVRKFLLLLLVSKTIKSTGIAYGCYYGIGFVQGLVRGAG
ncbi:MAG: hypothetical protein WD208_04035 [Dehalococcoidia bacterium]